MAHNLRPRPLSRPFLYKGGRGRGTVSESTLVRDEYFDPVCESVASRGVEHDTIIDDHEVSHENAKLSIDAGQYEDAETVQSQSDTGKFSNGEMSKTSAHCSRDASYEETANSIISPSNTESLRSPEVNQVNSGSDTIHVDRREYEEMREMYMEMKRELVETKREFSTKLKESEQRLDMAYQEMRDAKTELARYRCQENLEYGETDQREPHVFHDHGNYESPDPRRFTQYPFSDYAPQYQNNRVRFGNKQDDEPKFRLPYFTGKNNIKGFLTVFELGVLLEQSDPVRKSLVLFEG